MENRDEYRRAMDKAVSAAVPVSEFDVIPDVPGVTLAHIWAADLRKRMTPEQQAELDESTREFIGSLYAGPWDD